ncbi:hypothetical protein KIH41_13525 [Litoribacter ruber]|uniref:hypothetical protein n=1 Tax=Litoribacter ruber TaxID=702568 RepID=UPI001BD92DF0|nr:hypothetical protein [Litoribacter ruber]MBT0812300.1 hypothetical protein [Litoribacter ruber]
MRTANLKIRPYIEYLARKIGYELVGEGNKLINFSEFKLYSRKLPKEICQENIDPYFSPVSVEIEAITSRVGFSFSRNDWHPFVETLKEYKLNSNLLYEDSTLAKLYCRYTPQNVQEVLTDQLSTPQKPLCDWPPKYKLISWIWTLNHTRVNRILKHIQNRKKNDGWIYYGPHDLSYGKNEFDRLIKVYNSIKYNGYSSNLSKSDPVSGYFLKKGKEIRFVLLEGNHRVSALQALGHKKVNVLIRKGHPAIVDYEKLHFWTKEEGGLYPSILLKQVFDNLFYGTGLDKARRYRLNI